jgi:two-component system, OmpR family, KDP operon response regulator KdpE
MDKTTILIIDDEVQIRRLLKLSLEKGGYGVVQAESGEEGTLQARTGKPDLAILDLGLPDMDGLAVLREIRRSSPLPVIILSVRSSEEDIIAALDAGADDYLTKPFRTGELLARVRACLRKVAGDAPPRLFSFGQLQIDLDARTVTKGSTPVKLTSIEFALLSLFARNAGRVLTHRYILEQVWGPAYVDETQYTRVHVGNLRKKIEEEPEHPHYIQTESGIGYRFVKS